MRVVHVFKDAFPPTYGGVEQHVWELTRALSPEFDFEILTSSRSRRRTEERLDGVRYVRVPEYGRIASTPLTPSWWNEIRRTRSALHLHLPLPLAELAALWARHRGPLLASYYADAVHYPRLSRAYAPLQQRFLERSDRIIVSSQLLAEGSPALARHRDRVVVIPFGVDPDDWPAEEWRVARIHRTHPGPIVLFLGRLVYYKGLDVLVDAMGRVEASLVVVGDGPQRRALDRRVRRAAPQGRVHLVGQVDTAERSAYYRAADVLVLPSISRAETFGIAMLEAMSLGTPVVSTEVGTATSWVNRSGETGLVVPPRDPEALAAAITALLNDDSLRRAMGAAAATRVRDAFSKRTMLEAFADVYRNAAATAPTGRPGRRPGSPGPWLRR